MRPWHRANARTDYREIADAAGNTLADCPSYTGGPSPQTACANAELIATGHDCGSATPGPWHTHPGHHPIAWLVRGGPTNEIVAMVRNHPDAAEIAASIVAARTPREPART